MISTRYTGKPQAHADTNTGTYWHALPPLNYEDARMQRALVSKKPFKLTPERALDLVKKRHVQ